MITSSDVELLRGLTKKKPTVARLAGDKNHLVLLYSKWFALELPVALFDPGIKQWEEAIDGAVTWRSGVPPGEGEYAQGIRWTNPEDGVALIKLIADSGVAFIHPSIYDVVTKKLPEPEFRLFVGDKPPLAIFSAGILVGGVGQVNLK
jgi:hypothetical protein